MSWNFLKFLYLTPWECQILCKPKIFSCGKDAENQQKLLTHIPNLYGVLYNSNADYFYKGKYSWRERKMLVKTGHSMSLHEGGKTSSPEARKNERNNKRRKKDKSQIDAAPFSRHRKIFPRSTSEYRQEGGGGGGGEPEGMQNLLLRGKHVVLSSPLHHIFPRF